MAAIADTFPEGALRTTNLIPASSDFTFCGWFYVSGTPNPVEFGTFFYRGNDPSLYTEVFWVGYDEDRVFQIYFQPGAVPYAGPVLTIGAWYFVAYTKSGTTHKVYLMDTEIATHDQDIDALTYTHEYLMTDYTAFDWMPTKMVRVREWDAALTLEELSLERLSTTAVRTADLWLDSPFTSNLTDVSGNGYNWSDVDGPLTFEADPTLPVIDDAVVWALDEGGAADDDLTAGVDDDGTAFAASLVTRPYPLANLMNQFEVKSGALIARAAQDVTIDVTILSDYTKATKTASVDLSPEGLEEHVIKKIDNLSLAELGTAQFEFADPVTPVGRWDLSHFAVRAVAGKKGS